MKKHALILFGIAGTLIWTRPALADKLHLHNGDQFSGTILNASNPKNLQFKTAFGQVIDVPWSTIAGLYDDDNVPVPFPSKPEPVRMAAPVSLDAPPAPPVQKQIPEPPAPEPETASKEQKDGIKWSGRFNLGASLQTGNTEQNSFVTDANIKARIDEKNRVGLKADFTREEDEGDLTEKNASIKGTYDYFFNEEFFLNNSLKFETDEIDQVNLRTTASTGLGHQVFDREDLKLQYIIGPSYLRTDYEDDEDESSLAGRWDFDYEQAFYDRLFELFQNHEFLVPSDDTGAFLFESSTGVRLPIRNGIVGTAQIDFDWNNDPALGTTEDDTEYSLKLGYEW